MKDFQEKEARLPYEMYIKCQVFFCGLSIKYPQEKEAQVISKCILNVFEYRKYFFEVNELKFFKKRKLNLKMKCLLSVNQYLRFFLRFINERSLRK